MAGAPIKLVNSNGLLIDAQTYIANGVSLNEAQSVKSFPYGYSSVATMLSKNPFYAAHRGGSLDWPEMSLYAYTQAAYAGFGALELSLARTSDGVWFGLHDATLNRTSPTAPTSYDPAAHTWSEIQAYSITGAVATNNPSQSARPYARWEDIIAAYSKTHIIFVDPKVAGSSYFTELLNMMDAAGGPTRFAGKYYGVSGGSTNTTSGWARACSDRGYSRWGYFYEADASNIAAYQGRWDILGLDYQASASTWAAITSYGKPVMGHICPDQAAIATAFGYGATGVMVSGALNVAQTFV